MKNLLNALAVKNKFFATPLMLLYLFWKFVLTSITVYFLIENGYPWVGVIVIIVYFLIKSHEGSLGNIDLDDKSSVSYRIITLKHMPRPKRNPIQVIQVQQNIELLEFRKDQLLVLAELKKHKKESNLASAS